MDIAGLSVALNQMQVKQQASLSVMKMTMNTGEAQASDMVKMLEKSSPLAPQAVDPNLGRMIDIKL